MEALQVLRDELSAADVKTGFTIFSTVLVPVIFQVSWLSSDRSGQRKLQRADYLSIVGFSLLFLFARSWLALVTYYVPNSYLVRSLIGARSHDANKRRMKFSTCLKPKPTAMACILIGMTRSQLLLDCKFIAFALTNFPH
jgi:hypothetical protein